MLSSDQFVILHWLNAQPAPVPLQQMAEAHAPAFTEQRIEELYRQGILDRKLIPYQGFLVAGYFVSDKGIALLESIEINRAKDGQQKAEQKAREAQRLQERHEDYTHAERRYRTQNKIAVIMPFITFALGLLVEHFYGIIGFLFG